MCARARAHTHRQLRLTRGVPLVMCVATLITLRLAVHLPRVSITYLVYSRETYIYIRARAREFKPPRDAFAPLKIPRSGTSTEMKHTYARAEILHRANTMSATPAEIR